ncbi:MAG: outer membrane protein assembly factor BamC, partial [Limnobacter sp.]|nr:outer membrane protein assembly factor BamC [Limnobacter sp.]
IPGESSSGAVSASDYYSGKQQAVAQNAQATTPEKSVLVPTEDIQIKRVGNTRSLLVKRSPEELWPKLREFWKKTGFNLPVDNQKIGLMETDWAENRGAIPMDPVRQVIGKMFDNVYSSNQRDKYRTRVEPLPNGGSEIFITHRGMEENFTDKAQVNLEWMSRPSDPELEVEMLNRLFAKLTGEERATKDGPQAGQDLITLDQAQAGSTITIREDFPLAWRRVGFGLDRAGFIVEDRDRANGIYYVKYSPDSALKKDKGGFFGKLFSSKDDNLDVGQSFQVRVSSPDNTRSSVQFLSGKGDVLSEKAAAEAANLLMAKLQ